MSKSLDELRRRSYQDKEHIKRLGEKGYSTDVPDRSFWWKEDLLTEAVLDLEDSVITLQEHMMEMNQRFMEFQQQLAELKDGT